MRPQIGRAMLPRQPPVVGNVEGEIYVPAVYSVIDLKGGLCINGACVWLKRLFHRQLACGNHSCERDCHKVKNDDLVNAGPNCRKCEAACTVKRPDGCTHPCPRGACHPGSCGPCAQIVRIWCHCGLTQPYIKCGQYCGCDEEEKEKMGCCQNQCPKLMSCGHR